MKPHPEQQLTALAALGKLDDLDQRRLVAHLPRCAACREELEEMRALTDLLGRRPAPELPAAPRRRLNPLPLAAGVAAAVTAALVLSLSTGSSGPSVRQVDLAAGSGAPHSQGLATLTTDAHGTSLTVRVGGLPEHEWCTVLITDKTGRTTKVLSWIADYEGSSRVRGTSPVPASQVASIDVVDDSGVELLRGQA